MMKSTSAALAMLTGLMVFSSKAALAAQTHRSGPIDAIQMDNHSFVGREDLVWVRLIGPWAGTSCLADWGYFNAKDNPQFVATMLTARAMGSPLDIYVDDSYTKVAGYCLITNVVI